MKLQGTRTFHNTEECKLGHLGEEFYICTKADVLSSQGLATSLGHKHIEECLFSMFHVIGKVGTKLSIH